MNKIHPTAIIESGATIGKEVEIGPYSYIGENVGIGDGCKIGARVMIEGWTTIGSHNDIKHGAVIGSEPQDLKFKGEKSEVQIGDHNMIREYVTINRGTVSGGAVTRIGNRNLIMAYCHVAHDVTIHNQVVMANSTQLAGHVEIFDYAVIGGLSGFHQYTRVGTMAMIGGASTVLKDVPPFTLVRGTPARTYGLNLVGLQRNHLPSDVLLDIQAAYDLLYRSDKSIDEAIQALKVDKSKKKHIYEFVTFIEYTKRGITKEGGNC